MSPADQQKYNERITALGGLYQPQIQNIQQQISTLPQQYEAQKSSLQQAKENAFRDITKTAARGGMFYTGFTPREEARYLGTTYLPGLQQLSQQETTARQGLMGQITGLQAQQKAAGLSYLDQLAAYQRADEIAARQAAATRAAGSGGFGIDLGNQTNPDQGAFNAPMVNKTAQGFQFTDASGKPINAAQYVALYQATGRQLSYRELLQTMANDGDANAKLALNYVGDDAQFGGAPEQYRAALEALGATGSFASPAKPKGNPSRVQAFYAKPLVNRLTLTPSEYLNQQRTNIGKVTGAYNFAVSKLKVGSFLALRI